jgi:hypothetical protein
MRPYIYQPRIKTERVRIADSEGTMHTVFDETGKKYGDLYVIRFVGVRKTGPDTTSTVWFCICSCGKELDVVGGALRQGTSISCGHVRRQNGIELRDSGRLDEIRALQINPRAHLASIAAAGGLAGGRKGMCMRWNIQRQKPCTCGEHFLAVAA